MSSRGTRVIVGGTSGIGRALAQMLAERGEEVVITGRDAGRAEGVAREIGRGVRGLALDLTHPEEIGAALADVGVVRHLVLAAIYRDDNKVRSYDVAGAIKLVTLKLVGYSEVVHSLVDRLTPDSSIVLFGGQARERPYPGSTTVTTINGGITAMVRTLAVELGPIRVNAIHPGIVGDSPAWNGKPPAVLEGVRNRTPTGRLATMDQVAGAVLFLLDNGAVNGVNLAVDGGWLLM
jgi:NAD(P)-dependent dehydrogenase (short-subunit alcohol dehydrogenase family)